MRQSARSRGGGEFMTRLQMLVVIVLTAMPALAAEQQQSALPGAFTGPGSHQCSAYLEGRALMAGEPITLDDLFLSWARGFMSALNGTRLARGLNSKQLSSMPDTDQIERMRAYCVAHPDEQYIAAVHALFDSLPELPGSGEKLRQMGQKQR